MESEIDPELQAAIQKVTEENYRLSNALNWIWWIASIHFWGSAFDPEHMRGLANIASDALNEEHEQLPDFEETTEKAREAGAKMADELSGFFD